MLADKMPKKHLEEYVSNMMSSNIVQTLETMLDTMVFKIFWLSYFPKPEIEHEL
jgi:hypothetical protein